MVSGSIRGVVRLGLCAAAVLAAGERGWLATRTVAAAGNMAGPAAVLQGVAAAEKPVIRGGVDSARAWLSADYRGLRLEKSANRKDGSLRVEVRFGPDHVGITVDRAGLVGVSRGGKRLQLDSSQAFERLQRVLAGSEAIFATRVLLAERESVSELKAPEMSLLSTAAFVASLAGDVDAPRRIATRFVEKHRGIYRSVRLATCFETYTNEVTAAWNDLQACMDEANQDDNIFARAYRRVACNAVWLVRSESAWIEYLGCLGPGSIIPQ
jgi:hypothetical protein